MYRWAVLRKAGGPPSFPSDPLACSSSTLKEILLDGRALTAGAVSRGVRGDAQHQNQL